MSLPGRSGKYDYYLTNAASGLTNAASILIYTTQSGLKSYLRQYLNKTICRHPDEAYLFINNGVAPGVAPGATHTLKILEKKSQNSEGSVSDKLMTGPAFRSEYEFLLGPTFKVEFAFCICAYLQADYLSTALKYQHLRAYNAKNQITVLFGDEPDYGAKLDAWLRC